MARAIKVNGTKFKVQDGFESSEDISAISEATGEITASGLTANKGDVVKIEGVGDGFDGEYVVAEKGTSNKYKLVADWGDMTVGSMTNAKVSLAKFSNKFCDIKSFSRSGSTIEQTDISTVCDDARDFETGFADSGSLTLTFNYRPDGEVQKLFADYEASGEKFWTTWEMVDGTVLVHYVGVETGMNIDGSVGGIYDSGITLKISKRPVVVTES